MTDEERATVQGMKDRARRNIILYIAATPAMIGLLVLTFVVLSSESPLTFVLAFVTLMTPAVSVLGTRDHLGQWRALRQDLALGTISVFEAPEGSSLTRVQRAETLTFSERLWTVDGVFHRKWKVARRTEVAATPEYAATAAECLRRSIPPIHLRRTSITARCPRRKGRNSRGSSGWLAGSWYRRESRTPRSRPH